MLGSLLKLLWTVITLPVRLILLPFKIASLIISLVVYGVVFLVLLLALFVFVL